MREELGLESIRNTPPTHTHDYLNNTEGGGRKEFKKKRLLERLGLQGKE